MTDQIQLNCNAGGFIQEGDLCYAGRHLLIDFYNCGYNPLAHEIEECMVQACIATGATVVFHYSHPFEGNGSSGVCVLAESHGTWHQWPENNFCAIDIFVCGTCDPERAIPILSSVFKPGQTKISLEKRGIQSV